MGSPQSGQGAQSGTVSWAKRLCVGRRPFAPSPPMRAYIISSCPRVRQGRRQGDNALGRRDSSLGRAKGHITRVHLRCAGCDPTLRSRGLRVAGACQNAPWHRKRISYLLEGLTILDGDLDPGDSILHEGRRNARRDGRHTRCRRHKRRGAAQSASQQDQHAHWS
eukprot:scaffold10890_cov135-Isochrysis_galbana.AAC.4